ncbi:hypothetical protein Trydic_g9331 [Trypoxylus dichotomus]
MIAKLLHYAPFPGDGETKRRQFNSSHEEERIYLPIRSYPDAKIPTIRFNCHTYTLDSAFEVNANQPGKGWLYEIGG